jgi:hypothetical protein
MKLISQFSEFNSKLYKILNFAAVWTNQKIKKQSTAIGRIRLGPAAQCSGRPTSAGGSSPWPRWLRAHGGPRCRLATPDQRSHDSSYAGGWRHWIAEMEALWLRHFGVQSEGRRGASPAVERQPWLAASRGDNRYKLQHQHPVWKGSTAWGTTSMVKKTRWHCVAA